MIRLGKDLRDMATSGGELRNVAAGAAVAAGIAPKCHQ